MSVSNLPTSYCLDARAYIRKLKNEKDVIATQTSQIAGRRSRLYNGNDSLRRNCGILYNVAQRLDVKTTHSPHIISQILRVYVDDFDPRDGKEEDLYEIIALLMLDARREGMDRWCGAIT